MRKSFSTSILFTSVLALTAALGDHALASNVSDAVTVTVGSNGAAVFGFSAGAFGTDSPTTTTDGYTYTQISSNAGHCKPNGCTSGNDNIKVSGFTADPGSTWLTSVSWQGCTLSTTGASGATYSYASGVATWIWSSDYCDFGSTGTATPVTIVHTLAAGTSGWITPKYQIVGITYAPPGSKSTAVYSNGFLSGTSTSNSSSFKSGLTITDTITGGFSLFGILNGNVTNTISAGWEQLQGTSSSITLVQQYSTGLNVPGPASSGVGVDHDYDTVYVWLNPAVYMTIYGTRAVSFGGYNWDARDTITGMDVIGLTLGQLRGTQPITSAATQARLNRTWDTNLGALTSVDYLAIAATDPFYNSPALNPNTDTSHRFELPNGVDLIFNYVPVPAGGQATGQTYTSSYSSTTVAGKNASTAYTVAYSVAGGASFNFLAALSGDIKVSSTYTYTNQWSSNVTSGTTQAANFTIYPPLSTDHYTGPTAIQVWKDNVYGTFMFYPEN